MNKDVKEKVKKEVTETKPKKTIRIPKFWKSTLFWVFLLFLQMGILYGISYWGYHNNRTPYWFDNFVQEKGIWKIYGVKVINDNFDLRSDLVQRVGNRVLISGFVREMYYNDNRELVWRIDIGDGEVVSLSTSANWGKFYINDCSSNELDDVCNQFDFELVEDNRDIFNEVANQYVNLVLVSEYDVELNEWLNRVEKIYLTKY
ncbi:MAG TPA: hypothetical protein PK957_04990 [Candidatus Dojkabacteria bacterium]|nr:hypothetical protein [Candidatus Dojkabacteria bacterium]